MSDNQQKVMAKAQAVKKKKNPTTMKINYRSQPINLKLTTDVYFTFPDILWHKIQTSTNTLHETSITDKKRSIANLDDSSSIHKETLYSVFKPP